MLHIFYLFSIFKVRLGDEDSAVGNFEKINANILGLARLMLLLVLILIMVKFSGKLIKETCSTRSLPSLLRLG